MSETWRARGATLEALLGLVVARALVAWVPFGRWRSALGQACQPPSASSDLHLDSNLRARRLSRAVDRAAARLPGESRCLAKAMALQWLLHRRALSGVLVVGVKPGAERGTLHDLHAWVVADGEIVIGATPEPHLPLYAATVP